MWFGSALCLVAALAAGGARAACEAGEAVIRFDHQAPPGSARAEAIADFAARADAALHGRACVAPRQGQADRALADLAAGRGQLALAPLGAVGRYDRRLLVYDLPFLFTDAAAVERFQASPTGRALLAALEPRGLRGLGLWLDGMKQLAADTPLVRPGDAAGLSFAAVGSDVVVAQFDQLAAKARALGLHPGPAELTWGEITSPRAAVTETNHAPRGDLVVAQAAWWRGLDPDLRATLDRLLTEAAHDANRLAVERADLARARAIRGGARVLRLTAAQRAAWVAAMAPVWRRFEPQIGAQVIAAALDASAP